MALSDREIQDLEDIKERLGIDARGGRRLSESSRNYGRHAGATPISSEQGEEIFKRTANPAIIKVAEWLEDE